MNQEMLIKLRKSLIKHEGYRDLAYIDTVNKITIGIGDNISDRPVEADWINSRCDKLTSELYKQFTEDYTWFNDLNDDRKIVLINMAYNMGYKRLQEFEEMIQSLIERNYTRASDEMLNSEWATQVPHRAKELAQAMYWGEYKP